MPHPLHTLAFIQPNQYKDSVALMRVAQGLLALPDVVNATLQLGNPANKDILRDAGLLTPEVADAGPSDIMVVVQARSGAAAEAARNEARAPNWPDKLQRSAMARRLKCRRARWRWG